MMQGTMSLPFCCSPFGGEGYMHGDTAEARAHDYIIIMRSWAAAMGKPGYFTL